MQHAILGISGDAVLIGWITGYISVFIFLPFHLHGVVGSVKVVVVNHVTYYTLLSTQWA